MHKHANARAAKTTTPATVQPASKQAMRRLTYIADASYSMHLGANDWNLTSVQHYLS